MAFALQSYRETTLADRLEIIVSLNLFLNWISFSNNHDDDEDETIFILPL
jgi:hypothetical protein